MSSLPPKKGNRRSGSSSAGSRYDDSRTGRYLTPDPIGLEGGIDPFVYVENDPVNKTDYSGLITFSAGVGAFGNFAPAGMGVETGIAISTRLTICRYKTVCYYTGWNTPVGGSTGLAGQIGSGNLCEGSVKSNGVYWYGGKGLGGAAQISFSGDGPAYGRGIIGPTGGGGAGYIHCKTTYFNCHNETSECKKNKCEKK